MPKVYFDALSSSLLRGQLEIIIVDFLHFSSLDKMEQMVARSSFLASRCQGSSATTYQSQIQSFSSLRGVKNPLKWTKFHLWL